ncbi:MAG: hypothetical protein RR235_05930 [Oscillospiraceae bacterium]
MKTKKAHLADMTQLILGTALTVAGVIIAELSGSGSAHEKETSRNIP